MSLKDFSEIADNGLKQEEDMLLVKNWMTPNPFCVQEGQKLAEAAEMMLELHVDGVPIVDESGYFVGMLTLRKMLQYFLAGDKGDSEVSNIPKRQSAIVRQEDSILEVISLPYDQVAVVDEDGETGWYFNESGYS